jgi:hypothetical protein
MRGAGNFKPSFHSLLEDIHPDDLSYWQGRLHLPTDRRTDDYHSRKIANAKANAENSDGFPFSLVSVTCMHAEKGYSTFCTILYTYVVDG